MAVKLVFADRAVNLPRIRGTVRAHLDAFEVVRRQYGQGSSAQKLALLEWLGQAQLKTSVQAEQLHRQLLFLRAYPDDPLVRAAVERQLASFALRIQALSRSHRQALEDSGIAGTVSRHRFDARIVEWLVARYPGRVDIDWHGLTDLSGLEFLLRLGLFSAEIDGFDSPSLTFRAWLRHARGGSRSTDLDCLLRMMRRERTATARWSLLWDEGAVPVAWRLPRYFGAATVPVNSIAYRTERLRPGPRQPRRYIATPLRRVQLLGPRQAQAVIDLARATLASRCREVYAITHANPREVRLAVLGKGAAVAIIGVRPEMRLSLESNYAFLLLVNGVPVGYGGVTPLFRQANTGINIFDAFRGGEASLLWAQTLRAFRTLFRVNRFVISPYQFGAGNREAIVSGAFWFYYRLGFRPVPRVTRLLAAREYRRIRQNRKHRTDAATLRRFATGNLELALPGARPSERFEEIWLEHLGLRVTKRVAGVGVQLRDERALGNDVRRALGTANRSANWRQLGQRQLMPLIALVSDLASWPLYARRSLSALLALKGAPQEIGFVRAAQRQSRLFAHLAALARDRDARS